MPRAASVAVPVPFVGLLTYRLPDELPVPPAGARVLVPLGSRTVTGCVISTEPLNSEDDRALGTGIRDVLDVLDDEPFLTADAIKLAMWMADYYACGPGEAMATAAPPLAWLESRQVVSITDAGRLHLAQAKDDDVSELAKAALTALADAQDLPVSSLRSRLAKGIGAQTRLPIHSLIRQLDRRGWVSVAQVLEGERQAYKTSRVAELTAQGLDVAQQLERQQAVPALGARQKDVLLALRAAPGGRLATDSGAPGVTADGLRRLAARGLVVMHRVPVERNPFDGLWGRSLMAPPTDAGRVLTAEQSTALDRLTALCTPAAFHVALVHGVTGSGKTEVYLRLADHVLSLGRRVLVLVPEIALTPATAVAFRSRFGDRVAIQHSGLSEGERHDQWQRIRRDDVDIVVGTRSAVFAPLASIGLIVVDEEHDGSYKQEESPRYNGRDLAIVRGQQERALVVLGSATPSMESYQHATRGRYELIPMEHRVMDRPLAAVRTVNMRDEFAACGPGVILSRELSDAVETRLSHQEQVLLLLNRRGFSTAVFCRQCGSTLECPNCSVSLVVHGRHAVACHYCGHGARVPRACQNCGGPYLEQMGFGTERVEADVRSAFPSARVARLDRDSARRRGAAGEVLSSFGRGEVDILIGTQMIAKGHDFPRVTLVGVISADIGLGLADFRASERTFQLLTQVVGRAGRGERPGEAVIQTLYPDHYSIRHACRQHYRDFFAEELQFRKGMRYPPTVALINGIVRGASHAKASADASDLLELIRKRAPTPSSFVALGPAPAPLARLKGEHRVQFFLKGTPSMRRAMRDAIRGALDERPDLRRRVSIDVDPLSVL